MIIKKQDVIIIGGGITGLTAAYQLQRHSPQLNITLLEETDKFGGKIATDYLHDCVIERGPDCFLSYKRGGIELSEKLNIHDKLQGRIANNNQTFVRIRGYLHRLPAGLTGLVPTDLDAFKNTDILSEEGKTRLAEELNCPVKTTDDHEESIAEFISRRFGKESFNYIIEPLMGGIYAGDATKMSLMATFPNLRALEIKYGSVIKGLHSMPPPTSSYPPFVSFKQGMQELIDALESKLKINLQRKSRVKSIVKIPSGYQVEQDDGAFYQSKALIITTPAFVTAHLLEQVDKRLVDSHKKIPYSSVATVVLAFQKSDLTSLPPGYGYVIPKIEDEQLLACTYISNKWENRADNDTFLVRVYLGRYGSSILDKDDETLLKMAKQELQRTLNIFIKEKFHCVYRWPNSMPQYTLGHLERIQQIETARKQYPGLFFAGASYGGVGIPDCICSAERAAQECLEFVRDFVNQEK